MIIKSFDVDHREPQSINGRRRFDWTNLYPSHHPCNQHRGRYPEGGVLFPADGDNIDEKIIQEICCDRDKLLTILFYPKDQNDRISQNTCDELDRIINSTSPNAIDIRTSINYYYNRLLINLHKLHEARKSEDPVNVNRYETIIRGIFILDSPYSHMLKLQFIELEEYFPKDN
jgi:hypothetical protein